ncbi:MAG: lysophospholipid acyltransferase family protein [Candidatus Omnitrophota bacterium]|nr:lysophospholipid acyltransferase family protein [Candidatus Omnitrophota bacterium]
MKIKFRRYYFYYLLKTLFFILSAVPLKVSLVVADILGKAAFRVVPKYRNIAVNNLDSVFSEDHGVNVRIAEGVFKNLARNGAEWIKLSRLDPGKIGNMVTEIHGTEHLDDVLSKGRGCVVLTFHFGNWELMGIYLRFLGYDGAVIVRRIYFSKYDKLIARMRRRFKVMGIYRDDSPKKMLKELKKGNVLGIVPDQDISGLDGVFVDFFGKKAYTPAAPVKLAMAAKTDIVPAFVIREKDGTHKIVIGEPLGVPQGTGTEEDLMRYTRMWTKVLEDHVRKYPEQWVWIHSRWKTRPPAFHDAGV